MQERQARASLSPSRAIGLVLRTLHLGAMAVLVGGAWAGAPPVELRGALLATGATGLALTVAEARHTRHWVYQLRGLFVLAHLGLAGLAGAGGTAALLGALAVGAVGTHLPKGLRHWSLRHRAIVD